MKRGGPLRRKTPLERGSRLKRSTRLAPRRERQRRSGRKLDPDFLAIVRTLPCVARDILGHVCFGPTDPDHLGPRPYGRKADDDTAVPLCRRAHEQRTDYPGPSSGIFREWPRAFMAEWKEHQIERARAAVAAIRARRAL